MYHTICLNKVKKMETFWRLAISPEIIVTRKIEHGKISKDFTYHQNLLAQQKVTIFIKENWIQNLHSFFDEIYDRIG